MNLDFCECKQFEPAPNGDDERKERWRSIAARAEKNRKPFRDGKKLAFAPIPRRTFDSNPLEQRTMAFGGHEDGKAAGGPDEYYRTMLHENTSMITKLGVQEKEIERLRTRVAELEALGTFTYTAERQALRAENERLRADCAALRVSNDAFRRHVAELECDLQEYKDAANASSPWGDD